MAFSCSITNKAQPSLAYIRDAIDRTVYAGIPEPRSNDLRYLANQGVLLINTALTTQIDTPLTHQKIWQSFIAYTLDTISSNKKDLIFVFAGKVAQNYEDLVSDNHTKWMISHPASAAHNQAKEWNCEDIFNKVNNKLVGDGKTKVDW